MIDSSIVRAVTFDCYGTLVDWESGISEAIARILSRHGARAQRAQIIEMYAEIEGRAESGPYKRYRDVLAEVMREYARRFGAALAPEEDGELAASVKEWPVFDETPSALRALKKKFKLGVLSNIDDDLFAGTRPKLGVELDEFVSAQQVRSYKPGEAHFKEGLKRLGMKAREVLHVAESVRHDVGPAKRLGFQTVWVNRAAGRPSASGRGGATPDLEVGSLGELIALLKV